MSAAAWARCRRALVDVVDEVFAVVGQVRDDALERHAESARQGRPMRTADVTALRASLRERVQQPGPLITGLGVIVAPGLLADRALHLEWWQRSDDRAQPALLQPDLNPASTGFYDYTRAGWFDVPRRTGARHVEGPYVDVHGTGDYVFTFTVPVQAGEVFVGVAGADVPASWLEGALLDQMPLDGDAVVLNAAGRVVLSGSSSWLVGELVVPAQLRRADVEQLPDLPWRLAQLQSSSS